jgi:multidrug efflux pump subunit AcrA (membrane-fusion protein)
MLRDELLNPKIPFRANNRYSLFIFSLIIVIISFLPWISFTTGNGLLTAINPSERIQSITAPLSGFINTWSVKEGDYVKQGQLIAELIDNDPSFLDRLGKERDAALAAVASTKLMMETSQIDLERQRQLFNQGLSARKEYEKAKIEQSKHSLEYSKALAVLTKSETQFSRQSTQKIVAPRDGYITRILPGERGQLLKVGTPIAIFTPVVKNHAVEVWVDGNDSAMIQTGQTAQIQFEGWPAIQIPGWPPIGIGTFPAKVHLVDNASSYQGKFRVLLVPDGQWPSQKFLRLGIHSKAYIKLNNSYIVREVWRQLTGFPAVKEPFEDELNRMLLKKVEQEDSK